MGEILPVRRFGGVPFVDDGFDSSHLLSAVVAMRMLRTQGERHAEPEAYLDPTLACADRYVSPAGRIDFSTLGRVQAESVAAVRSEVAKLIPVWGPLVSIPLSVRRLNRPGVISASSYGYPQHVFLADEAFKSRRELREQFVHECAHNWIYLIAEIEPIEKMQESRPDLTLPSGTGNKSPSEVLGALHVSLSLYRLYGALTDDTASNHDRRSSLAKYIRGCGDLLSFARGHLTAAGNDILDSLSMSAKELE